MKKKKVWRYYCEYCKKSGCSGGHIKRHEERCTMNPNRHCGMCKMLEQEQPDIKRLLSVLPNPDDYTVIETYDIGSFGAIEIKEYIVFKGLEEAVEKTMPKLRAIVGDCPACVMAALRQKGIPVPAVKSFNFSEECKEIWAWINERNTENRCGYY